MPLHQLARHFDGRAKRKVLLVAPVPLVIAQVIFVGSLCKFFLVTIAGSFAKTHRVGNPTLEQTS